MRLEGMKPTAGSWIQPSDSLSGEVAESAEGDRLLSD